MNKYNIYPAKVLINLQIYYKLILLIDFTDMCICIYLFMCVYLYGLFAGVAENGMSTNCAGQTDIPGLSSRVKNPFEFLGLYQTQHNACRRHDIPAKMVG